MYSKKASFGVNDWLHELSPKIQYCRLKIGISNTSNLSLDYTRICSKTWQNLSIYNVLFFFSFSPSSSSSPSFLLLHFIYCVDRGTHTTVSMEMPETTYGSQFFLSSMWVPETGLMLSGLVSRVSMNWAILMAPWLILRSLITCQPACKKQCLNSPCIHFNHIHVFYVKF